MSVLSIQMVICVNDSYYTGKVDLAIDGIEQTAGF
jgi:hypothetical protein